MKEISFLFIISLMTLNSFGQLTPQEKLSYEQKIQSYKGMKSAGSTIAFLGGISGMAGAYLTVQGNHKIHSDKSTPEDILKGTSQQTWGIALVCCGGAMLITGLVLNSVGNRKTKEYQQKLDLGILYNKEVKGMSLTYRF